VINDWRPSEQQLNSLTDGTTFFAPRVRSNSLLGTTMTNDDEDAAAQPARRNMFRVSSSRAQGNRPMTTNWHREKKKNRNHPMKIYLDGDDPVNNLESL
jgi:hypothetical protein